ncbi:MAG: DMT family transporter [Tabrizicola sp.]|uniref:DMT family transporter n=1 Tax=Tabrizicola sp. TaxID=2005166 RepID=UPI002736D1C2|nr:DMT family transporter [Tabrizicola sp.]MDP3264995.1 DMT family transporter [Tabrizicola sp.]MDP3647462.1 DMT family transporter [Paracoccaceae bacterium]MDZ4068831.1 DMT family transporter [Tabrizicola sp.]
MQASPTLAFPASPVSRGIALMILAILLFTAMDATAKGLIARYPAPQVVWARFAGQFLIVLLILRAQTGPLLRTRFPALHVVRSAFQFGATTLFFLSLTHIGLAEATALTDINPVLITLGAAVFLGERLGPRRLAGVIVALIGALIIIRPGAGVFSPWALLPLGAAICYTGNALITRFIGAQESAWTSMLYASLFGTVVAAGALPYVWIPIPAADLAIFALVGALGTGAQLCIIRSFSMAEASVVAPFAYLGIVFATGWGIVLYDQWPDRWTVIGALVIVGAGLYVWHRETTNARKT